MNEINLFYNVFLYSTWYQSLLSSKQGFLLLFFSCSSLQFPRCYSLLTTLFGKITLAQCHWGSSFILSSEAFSLIYSRNYNTNFFSLICPDLQIIDPRYANLRSLETEVGAIDNSLIITDSTSYSHNRRTTDPSIATHPFHRSPPPTVDVPLLYHHWMCSQLAQSSTHYHLPPQRIMLLNPSPLNLLSCECNHHPCCPFLCDSIVAIGVLLS